MHDDFDNTCQLLLIIQQEVFEKLKTEQNNGLVM